VGAAEEIGAQVAAGNRAIVGIMLESFLVEGRQDLGGGRPLTYGQSITDACINWETTVSLLDGLAAAARGRRGA
jgi:3-deoxy-7-phosphoheptulonate synthase